MIYGIFVYLCPIRATVKREDGPLAEPPAALEL